MESSDPPFPLNGARLEEPSDDEADWEEVEVGEEQHQFEITIPTPGSIGKRNRDADTKKKGGVSHAERLLRIDCHKVHTVALLGNAWVRNKWLNDELLHGRLLSLTPMHLQNSFAMIHKSRVPEQTKRGRLFEQAMVRLTEWWYSQFFEVLSSGHIRNMTYEYVQERIKKAGLLSYLQAKDSTEEQIEPFDIETLQEILDDEGERIREPKSLMKHALMRSGCRDTSGQLFTALCRALGIPARLVVSVQSVPWQVGVGKPKPKYTKKGKGKGKQKEKEPLEEAEDDEMEEVNIPGSSTIPSTSGASFDLTISDAISTEPTVKKSAKAKGKEKAKPEVKLRKPKPKPEPQFDLARLMSPDPTEIPPIFWTEVFSRPDGRWIPVDPLRNTVNKPRSYDPSSPSNAQSASVPGQRTENRMLYVVAFEEDGYAKDVTRKYAHHYGAKIAKVQGGSSKSKGRMMWWEGVMSCFTRPYRLHRDDVEDDEMELVQLQEGLPTTIAGFKDHPIYVLPRHLKQTEAIFPPPPATNEIAQFRGEPVYPRSSIVQLKTAENWWRSEGRNVSEGEQPLKTVKMKANTVGRLREIELLKEAGSNSEVKDGMGVNEKGEVMQGLYARHQTEMFRPPPVVDGVIPKNTFGNIDLYVPSMLPQGAKHLSYKGIAKIARKLGVEYAEAVVGFEFRQRRATPIIDGIVVATENEQLVLEAFLEAEQDAEEKARVKREEQVIKRWTKLIQGLRIRARLQEQYATAGASGTYEEADAGPSSLQMQDEDTIVTILTPDAPSGGGFLTGADDVVQAFNLPRYQHISEDLQDSRAGSSILPNPMALPRKPSKLAYSSDLDGRTDSSPPEAFGVMDLDSEDEQVPSALARSHYSSAQNGIMPKSIKELAEEATLVGSILGDEEDVEMDAIAPEVEVVQVVSAGRRETTEEISAASTRVGRPSRGATTSRQKRPSRPQPKKRKRRKSESEEEEEAVLSTRDNDSDEENLSPAKKNLVSKTKTHPQTSSAGEAGRRSLRPRTRKSYTFNDGSDEDS